MTAWVVADQNRAAFAYDMEPELVRLRDEIDAEEGGPGYCANRRWWDPEGYRDRLVRLVGCNSPHTDLRGMGIYSAVYRDLYERLPDCSHEGWFCV